MVAPIADGLRPQMIFVLVGKAQTAYMLFPRQQLLEPLAYFFVPALQAIIRDIVQLLILHVDVEGEILLGDVRRSQLCPLRLVADHAHILVHNELVRHGILDEVPAEKFPDVVPLLLRNAHQSFLFLIWKQHIPNDVVPVVVPCAQLLQF